MLSNSLRPTPEVFLFHQSKLFGLKPFLLHNVIVEADQTILNHLYSTGHIRRVFATVGVLDYPDPAIAYDFYPVFHMEH